MNQNQAVKSLQGLIQSRQEQIKVVSRKRWRDSEKAMTIASLNRDIEALQFAVNFLTGVINSIPKDR